MVEHISALLADQGVLLEAARGPAPNVAQLVAGEPIRGSWWSHRDAHTIFAVINALADDPDVARTRLVNGRITLVHRRLWAPLLRLAGHFPPDALQVVVEEHGPTGAHHTRGVDLATWVGADVRARAAALDEQAARAALPPVVVAQMS